MRARLLLLLLVAVVGAASVPVASTWATTFEPTATATATATATTPPDTPAGDQLAWVLGTLDAPETLSVAGMAAHLAPGSAAAAPPQDAIAATVAFANAGSPFAIERIEPGATATEVAAVVRARTGERYLVGVVVEPAPPHRILDLVIEPAPDPDGPPVAVGTWAKLDAALTGLASATGFLAAEVTDGACRPVHAVGADRPLAVASAIKLYILGALADAVERGAATWDEPLAIREEWKSLPAGDLRLAPAGTAFTLREYAAQMISVSDNTATDHLLFRLGRDTVAAFQAEMGHADPTLNSPFPSTREILSLQFAAPAAQRDAYADASPGEKRRLLAEAARIPLDVAYAAVEAATTAPSPAPGRIDAVEWFATSEDLCRAMASLAERAARPGLVPVREILAINPGLALDPATWTETGYKGGSEPGVLNLTWLLRHADGRRFVLTATFNNPDGPVDESAASALMASAVALLEHSSEGGSRN